MRSEQKTPPGILTVDELWSAVDDGTIDTVILAFPDLYGRMLGKRLDASFFLTDVAGGTHACDYLFTVDMEMEPVPGYEFSNWDLGYGDVHLGTRSRNAPKALVARSDRAGDLRRRTGTVA